MVNQNYMEYIQSDEWDVRRKRCLDLAKYHCERCGIGGVTLHVHHKTYRNFKNEPQSDLEALCVGCHRIADKERKARKYREIRARQLDGWGRKVYGEGWEIYPGYEHVREEFYDWLKRKGY